MGQEEDFLQSEVWLRFQESAGHGIIRVTDGGVSVGGIVHLLPIAGKYLYTPRFPWSGIPNTPPKADQSWAGNFQLSKLVEEAKKRNCGWMRVEPETEVVRNEIIRSARNDGIKTVKAPHDMQPRETFVVDISKDESVLLAEMKSKTRYNIRLAEKKGVRVFVSGDEKYRKAFVDLVTGTADRKGIVPHPRRYYETMLDTLLGDSAALFVAEHEGDILGANLMIFHGDTATYLHGGSADVKREHMAPFLLQWEAMKEAKHRGCVRYDFGGVRTVNSQQSTANEKQSAPNGWEGITRFKTGFSPATAPTAFPGCYDIILSPSRYFLYRFFSTILSRVAGIRRLAGV